MNKSESVVKYVVAAAMGLQLLSAPAMAEGIPDSVYQSYMSAVSGNKSATKKTFKALTELREENPDNLIVSTVLGSTETLVARDAWVPWKKLKYAELGLSRMDKALKKAATGNLASDQFAGLPADLWMKTTVGCTFVAMPDMFDRLQSGYQLLVSAIESPGAQDQGVTPLASMYLCAGQAAVKIGQSAEARKYLTALVNSAPESDEASVAKSLLREVN